MCGIVAVLDVGGSGPVSREVLDRMAQAIAHRGPDERGLWVEGPIGLAAQRLRVVDLATGQQPLANEDGGIRLVANGEIYNADAVRRALLAGGHRFASRTDTEVILHAYEDDGPACLDRLEGMFAFALWDGPRRRLVLARDRFGEKPLYYARLPHAFLLASELKALLVHPDVSRELDSRALVHYLANEYVPAPHAIFRAVRKLPAAHYMTVEADGTETIERYWVPPRPTGPAPPAPEAAEEVVGRLRRSVASRVLCDVPWGCLLSGGIDSSLVTALAAEASSAPVKTFAIGFDEPTYDERRYAAAAARRFGTEHHETVVRGEDAAALLPEVARVFDEPFADASSLPAVMLSRLAREQVTVVLSGDGGDELFCGYPTQTAHRAAEAYGRLPRLARRAVAAAAEGLPTSHRTLASTSRSASPPCCAAASGGRSPCCAGRPARFSPRASGVARSTGSACRPAPGCGARCASWPSSSSSQGACAGKGSSTRRTSPPSSTATCAAWQTIARSSGRCSCSSCGRGHTWADEAAAPARRRPRGPALCLATRAARLLGHRGDVRRAGPRDGAHR